MLLINNWAPELTPGFALNQTSAVRIGNIITRPITITTMFFWICYFSTYPTFRLYELNTFLGSFYNFSLYINSSYFFWISACFTGSTLCLSKGSKCIYLSIFSTILANGTSIVMVLAWCGRWNFYFSSLHLLDYEMLYFFFKLNNLPLLLISCCLLYFSLLLFNFCVENYCFYSFGLLVVLRILLLLLLVVDLISCSLSLWESVILSFFGYCISSWAYYLLSFWLFLLFLFFLLFMILFLVPDWPLFSFYCLISF